MGIGVGVEIGVVFATVTVSTFVTVGISGPLDEAVCANIKGGAMGGGTIGIGASVFDTNVNDVVGTVTSAADNYSTDGFTPASGDPAFTAPPQLGALNTSGDVLPYYEPDPGSPLLNATTSCAPTDQRLVTRTSPCDIGAIESNN